MEPEIIARHKSLTKRLDKAEGITDLIEFFFDAPSEKAAGDLSNSLRELGYVLYERSGNIPAANSRPDVSGHTSLIDDSLEVLTGWYEAMTKLAEFHSCEFDGYGRFHTDPEEPLEANE